MIEPRSGPGGATRYRVRLYFRGRYVTSRTFDRLGDARTWERERTRELTHGTYIDPRRGDQTFSTWFQQWQDSLTGIAPDTIIRYEQLGRVHVVPKFGRLPISTVKASDVQKFASELSVKRSRSTARQAVGVIRQVCDFAIADGALLKNPAIGVRLGKMPAGEPRPLTHEQLWILASSMRKERDALLILLAGYTGMRWGEITALTVEDFNTAQRRITITKAISDLDGHLVVGEVKTHASRSVLVPRSVAEPLIRYCGRKNTSELIFPSAANTPLSGKNFRRDALSIAPNLIGRTVTPHELRDTAASLAISAGGSIVAVARMLGHESAAITLKHYANLLPSDLTDIDTRLNNGARKAVRNHPVSWSDLQ